MPTHRSTQWSFQNTLAAAALGTTLIAMIVLFAVGDVWTAAPWLAIVILIVLVAALLIPMTIEAGAEGVKVRLAGITVRRIPFEDIVSVGRRDYKPLKEFGGWGLRWGLTHRNARAYTTTGTSAVVVTLRDGSEVYLGVDDEDRLTEAIALRIDA